MADTSTTLVEASDAQLIAAVRDGDTEAYGELFDRHREAATRLSSQLVPGPDADDLVAESFTRVLTLLQAGKGPDEFFRAYLLTSIRRLHIDRTRLEKRVRTTDDEAELDRAIEFVDPAEMRFEQGAAAAAFAALPERWQLVLWHLDVEGQKPADIAPLLGMSPNSVSALAYRAREGLRQAYLQSHLAPSLHASCHKTTGMLGSYVRRGLSTRDSARVEAHLDECSRCMGLYLELSEINSNLSGILGPALLGTAAAGYVTSGAAFAGIGAAVDAVFAPVKAAVASAGTQGVVAAAVVVTVAAVGTIAVTNDFGANTEDPPHVSAPRVSTPAPAPPTAGGDETAGPEPTTTATTPGPTTTTPTTPGPTTTTSAPAVTAPTDPEPTTSRPSPEPETSPSPSPSPSPTVEPIVPTDYAIASVRVTDAILPLLQRQLTIDVSATNSGRAAAETVTLTLAFRRSVQFRGVVSPGWDCGSTARNQHLETLTCSRSLGAGQGTSFVVKTAGLLHPEGTVTVTAPGDPVPGNNSARLAAGLWPLN
ncbi:sigma-70 family RNA polymerase sigma factor [Aeromicrobium sp.]|uniref:sigma-70 family RNA polymerase sigma factor n=1 Tax=Aeromicrobium sp. TaxID=1871063 RepID=UPI002FC7DDA0